MGLSFGAVILSGVVIAQMCASGAKAEQNAGTQLALASENASGELSALPAMPRGKSTIIGGEVQNVDPVRDEFSLKVLGQRPMKILFDERTQIYLDGKRIKLHDLRSNEHGSVQTVLEGTDVFALSIHLLSGSAKGDYQGRVVDYNPETRELTVSAAMSHESIKLLVPINTPIVHQGQRDWASAPSGLSDLAKGALISLTFESDRKGGGVASQIAILASPGSAFVFGGNLSSLDMHSGSLVLVDPRDEKSYEVFFDAARLPTSHTLHEGDYVRVTATFDGSRYEASEIAVD